MDRATVYWHDRFWLRHHKSAACPQAGLLCVGITGRVEITAVVARIKGNVRFAPVCAQSRYRIFQHPWRARYFSDDPASLDQLQGVCQSAESLVAEPPRAADGQMRAWREGKHGLPFLRRRSPSVEINADPDQIPIAVDSRLVLNIDDPALMACLKPGFHHISRSVAQTQNRQTLSPLGS